MMQTKTDDAGLNDGKLKAEAPKIEKRRRQRFEPV